MDSLFAADPRPPAWKDSLSAAQDDPIIAAVAEFGTDGFPNLPYPEMGPMYEEVGACRRRTSWTGPTPRRRWKRRKPTWSNAFSSPTRMTTEDPDRTGRQWVFCCSGERPWWTDAVFYQIYPAPTPGAGSSQESATTRNHRSARPRGGLGSTLLMAVPGVLQSSGGPWLRRQ